MPAVENAAVLRAPSRQLAERGCDRFVHHLVDDVGAGERHGRVRAHAAGVRPLVAVERALVVLRGGERERVGAVAQREDGQLGAGHALLDHARAPRRAERGAGEVRLHRVARVGERFGDDDALAGSEPVGLDHVEAGQRVEERERLRFLARVEGRVPGGRHARGREHFLHPGFRAFELRGRGRTPEDEPPGAAQRVGDTRDERRFGSDDDEIGIDTLGERGNRGGVGGDDGDTVAQFRQPRVAGRRDHLVDGGRTREAPAERVLAPSGTDEEHARHQAARGRTTV